MKNPNIALIRGAFLNPWEMQNYVPLKKRFNLTAFSSLKPLNEKIGLPLMKLPSPMDLPNFPYKMPILNRIFVDAHWLFGLEKKLKGFDIAHVAETYYAYTHQALEAKKRGWVKKVVSTCWEIIPHNNEGIWGRKQWKKQAIDQIDHFICPTELAKQCLIEEGCSEEKISVVRMGVDLNKFKIKNEKLKITIKNLKLPKLKILFVGRLEEEKGIWELLRVFKSLVNSFTPGACRTCPPVASPPPARFESRSESGGGDGRRGRNTTQGVVSWQGFLLTIVGDGSQKEKIREFIKNSSMIRIIELKSRVEHGKINEEYKKADIFVLPSKPTKFWQEQYGMVLVEAMAAGLPIVASKTGAIPEVLGEAGILVKPGNVVQLTKALSLLVQNQKKRLELGIKARKRAEKFFNRNKVAERIEKVYKEVLVSFRT